MKPKGTPTPVGEGGQMLFPFGEVAAGAKGPGLLKRAIGNTTLGKATNLALLAYLGYDVSQMLGDEEGKYEGVNTEDLEKALLMSQLEQNLNPSLGGDGFGDMLMSQDEDVYLNNMNSDLDYANQLAQEDFLNDLMQENAGLLQQISQLQGQMGMQMAPGMMQPPMGMPPGMPPMPPGMPPMGMQPGMPY
jgi:hypothetical protein